MCVHVCVCVPVCAMLHADYFLSVVRDPLTAEKLWSAHAKGTAPLALPSNTTTTDLESDRDTHKDTQMGTGERLAAADISTPSWYQVCVCVCVCQSRLCVCARPCVALRCMAHNALVTESCCDACVVCCDLLVAGLRSVPAACA